LIADCYTFHYLQAHLGNLIWLKCQTYFSCSV